MKLVEILARELGEWPPTTVAYVQDWYGSTWPLIETTGVYYKGSWKWRGRGDRIDQSDNAPLLVLQIATDYATAIITRTQWQAERDRIAKEQTNVKSKANKDGWIRHRGGKCPVEAGTLVDVRHRDGKIAICVPAMEKMMRPCACDWDHDDSGGDIMAWRPHVADQGITKMPAANILDMLDNPGEPNEALKAIVALDSSPTYAGLIAEGILDADEGKLTPIDEVKAKYHMKPEALILDYTPATEEQRRQWYGRMYRENPLQWRDRIRSIDTHKIDAEAKHIAVMLELDNERDELVKSLAAEGFVLISESSQAGVADGVQTDSERGNSDISADMQDTENWLAGDLVQCLDSYGDQFSAGSIYELRRGIDRDMRVAVISDDKGKHNGWKAECFKWHSRPKK